MGAMYRLALAALAAATLTTAIVTPAVSSAAKCSKKKKCKAKKKAAAGLKDGHYTFKNNRGKVNTLTISGGGKKVTISFVHFGGTPDPLYPYCAETLVNHGTFKLKTDYVEKTKLGFTDGDDFSFPVPAIAPDGLGGGGASANGTIDPKKLTLTGQFSVKMYPTSTRGPNVAYSCLETPTVVDAKLTKKK